MKKLSLSVKILVGLVLGIIVGLMLQKNTSIAVNYIKPIGTLFLNLIKMIIIPLVFSSLVVGACGLGDVKKFGRIGGKTVLYYLCTTAIAVVIGLTLGNIFNVGKGISIPTEAVADVTQAPKFIDTLLNIIPSNPIDALAKGNMLQIIVFALFIGAGIVAVGDKAKVVKEFFEGFAEIMYKTTHYIMLLAPYAVFALITPVVAESGAKVLGPLLGLILVVYLGCILHAVFVYSASVAIFAKMSPIRFFKAMIKPMTFAFSTASSSATLPFSIEATEELGVPASINSFVLPLGATINMDGTALYQGICALFIASIYSIDLSFGQQVTIVLTATLASIGTAGVPGAGMIMLGIVLQAVGLPMEGIAIIAGVDRILDMARTTVNITGDAACSVVIAASEKELKMGQTVSK